MAAMQIDASAGEIDGRNGRICAIRIEAGRVWSFPRIVVKVELEGDAVGYSFIAKPSTDAAKRRRSRKVVQIVFADDRERKTVGHRIGKLKGKSRGEGSIAICGDRAIHGARLIQSAV